MEVQRSTADGGCGRDGGCRGQRGRQYMRPCVQEGWPGTRATSGMEGESKEKDSVGLSTLADICLAQAGPMFSGARHHQSLQSQPHHRDHQARPVFTHHLPRACAQSYSQATFSGGAGFCISGSHRGARQGSLRKLQACTGYPDSRCIPQHSIGRMQATPRRNEQHHRTCGGKWSLHFVRVAHDASCVLGFVVFRPTIQGHGSSIFRKEYTCCTAKVLHVLCQIPTSWGSLNASCSIPRDQRVS